MRKRISSEASDFYRTIFPYLIIILALVLTAIFLIEKLYIPALFFGFGLIACLTASFLVFFKIFDSVYLDYDSKTILAENRNSKRRISRGFEDLSQVEMAGFRFVRLIFTDGSTILIMLPGLGFLYDESTTQNIIKELKEIKSAGMKS